MTEGTWSAVDRYLAQGLVEEDDVLRQALAAGEQAGLPQIQVSPALGKLLYLLACSISARRVLEIGTLAGYSTIWLARALPPDGRLVTLELEPRHAEVARRNLAEAGLAERVEVMVGPAADSLRQLAGSSVEPFDLTFIDADKESYRDYLEGALQLARSGSLIVADNVVRAGALADLQSSDPRVVGVRRMLEMAAADERLETTVLQTVGSKGYDGIAIALVR